MQGIIPLEGRLKSSVAGLHIAALTGVEHKCNKVRSRSLIISMPFWLFYGMTQDLCWQLLWWQNNSNMAWDISSLLKKMWKFCEMKYGTASDTIILGNPYYENIDLQHEIRLSADKSSTCFNTENLL